MRLDVALGIRCENDGPPISEASFTRSSSCTSGPHYSTPTVVLCQGKSAVVVVVKSRPISNIKTFTRLQFPMTNWKLLGHR